MPLERFRDYPEWDRYTLTHTEPVIDRTGEIQRVIDEKGRLSDEEKASIPPLALDAYMNSLYRGLKRPDGHRRPTPCRLSRIAPPPHLPVRPRGTRAAVPRLPRVGARELSARGVE